MFVHKLPFLLNPVFCILQSSIISNLIWKENAHTQREYKTVLQSWYVIYDLVAKKWQNELKKLKNTVLVEVLTTFSFSWRNF